MFSFVESVTFTRIVDRYLTESEQQRLQLALMKQPKSGVVIPGSGGVRKLRWRAAGRGKRGGLRVIYVIDWNESAIFLLTIYGKNEQQDIPLQLLKKIRERL